MPIDFWLDTKVVGEKAGALEEFGDRHGKRRDVGDHGFDLRSIFQL